jgi:hypothetical protein
MNTGRLISFVPLFACGRIRNQSHWHPRADGIVHLSHCISVPKQLCNGGRSSWGCHFGPIPNIGGRQADTREVGRGFDLDRGQTDTQARRLPVKVIAIASGQGKQQELASIDAGTLARTFGWNGQVLTGAAGTDRDDEAHSRVRDDRRDIHSQSPKMPAAGLTRELSGGVAVRLERLVRGRVPQSRHNVDGAEAEK